MIAENDIYKAPADVWARLAAPLPPTSIEWRQDGKPITRDGKFFARFVAYVEAGTVRQRLDSVVPGEWDLTMTPLPSLVAHEGSDTLCAFKGRLQILGVVREDVGQGSDYKSAVTDSFKRAAVRFGIGHELYDMPLLWVELDGDGKYAKPLEDPASIYARKQGTPKPAPPRTVPGADENPTPAGGNGTAQPASARPASALAEEQCPKCGGRMFDNRLTKRNPKAPDFKCRDRSCDGVIWPEKKDEKKAQTESGPGLDHDWPPLHHGPLVPDTELPF